MNHRQEPLDQNSEPASFKIANPDWTRILSECISRTGFQLIQLSARLWQIVNPFQLGSGLNLELVGTISATWVANGTQIVDPIFWVREWISKQVIEQRTCPV